MKRFKRIYVEITNICNMNCDFCSKTNRIKKEMSVPEFSHVLDEIKEYTDYIYIHVKGEPLLHSNLDRILDLCTKNNIKVNITTNGTMLYKKLDIILKNNCVRQINISLHSFDGKEDNYIDNLMEAVSKLTKKGVYIVYRFWTLKDNKLSLSNKKLLDKIENHYKLDNKMHKIILEKENIRIDNNTYINKGKEFCWPTLNNGIYSEKGTCIGLKNQIAILSDGTIVPCCLDAEGIISLGNIFQDSFKNIVNSKEVDSIINGFNNNKKIKELCKHCNFYETFK